jgi:PAS domain S-box-containing protein
VEGARRLEAALRESEERFRGFADASPAVLWIAGAEGEALEYLSPSYERVWGEPRDAVLRDLGRWADLLHPEDRAAAADGLRRVFGGERVSAEYRIRRGGDGAVRWIRDVAFPIRDAEGRVRRAGGLAQDITDEREAGRRQRVLLDELNHRVKNALAGVQALAAQTARGQDGLQTPDAFFRAFGERLIALGRAHDLLTREAWQGASLSEVVRGTLAPYDGRGADPARIVARGPEVRLVPNAAVALHMAFHELATNAARYGALTAREGRVEVAWSVAPGAAAAPNPDEGAVLKIRWRERGGPRVPGPPARRGFGSRLVERGLSRQLGGEARLDFQPAGVEFSLRLPLSARVQAAG